MYGCCCCCSLRVGKKKKRLGFISRCLTLDRETLPALASCNHTGPGASRGEARRGKRTSHGAVPSLSMLRQGNGASWTGFGRRAADLVTQTGRSRQALGLAVTGTFSAGRVTWDLVAVRAALGCRDSGRGTEVPMSYRARVEEAWVGWNGRVLHTT
jgi:hypothetical protein